MVGEVEGIVSDPRVGDGANAAIFSSKKSSHRLRKPRKRGSRYHFGSGKARTTQ